MSIAAQLLKIKKEIPAKVTLVAVSKTKPVSDLLQAYEAGQRIFGENKVQELCAKQLALPEDVQWHFIGHLQSNKVKYIAPFVSLIHSVDSLKLLREINKEGIRNQRVISCLLEFHIAAEESKFGLDEAAAIALLEDPEFEAMHNVRIEGVMGMATFTDHSQQIHREFQQLRQIFDRIKGTYFADKDHFSIVSMGMSDDYSIAIEEGSTMIRVGSSIFGARQKG